MIRTTDDGYFVGEFILQLSLNGRVADSNSSSLGLRIAASPKIAQITECLKLGTIPLSKLAQL